MGKILARWKVGKFFIWRVHNGKLEWQLDQSRVDTEQSLDGCYVIRTDASESLHIRSLHELDLVEQHSKECPTTTRVGMFGSIIMG